MTLYVEVTLDVYDQDEYVWAVGPFQSRRRADVACKSIARRLNSKHSVKILDDKYGEGGYSVGVMVRRMRTVGQAIDEVLE